ncbi:uncharacterized protein DEA37_0009594 [Paragonimus westermani]|uniref:UDENN domain-containing protein n=1 Tax=Paragonimus westermani TaxID=34504 RepID=A0A5J4P022_9TREM|nr:uncharacterized protein DEA37_0009594 [Paragonimus westermani]
MRMRYSHDSLLAPLPNSSIVLLFVTHWNRGFRLLCSVCHIFSNGLPWFGCFHGLLDIIWRNDLYRDSRWHVLHPFLSRLMTTGPPPPSVDHVTCSDPFNISRHIKFRIPTSSSPHNLKYVMEYYNALDTSLWIHIFVCLLLERSVLFHSKRLSRLTSCVLASVSLLYPLQWVNSFYPLIPKRVIEVLGYVAFIFFILIFVIDRCPVPFVAGIHACNLEAAMENINPGTCLVDLDTGVVRMFEEKFVTPKAVYHFLRHEMKDVQRQLKAALNPKKTKNVNWKKVDGEACNFFEQLTKPFFRLIVNLLGKPYILYDMILMFVCDVLTTHWIDS